jgi:hypothetical protein
VNQDKEESAGVAKRQTGSAILSSRKAEAGDQRHDLLTGNLVLEVGIDVADLDIGRGCVSCRIAACQSCCDHASVPTTCRPCVRHGARYALGCRHQQKPHGQQGKEHVTHGTLGLDLRSQSDRGLYRFHGCSRSNVMVEVPVFGCPRKPIGCNLATGYKMRVLRLFFCDGPHRIPVISTHPLAHDKPPCRQGLTSRSAGESIGLRGGNGQIRQEAGSKRYPYGH